MLRGTKNELILQLEAFGRLTAEERACWVDAHAFFKSISQHKAFSASGDARAQWSSFESSVLSGISIRISESFNPKNTEKS